MKLARAAPVRVDGDAQRKCECDRGQYEGGHDASVTSSAIRFLIWINKALLGSWLICRQTSDFSADGVCPGLGRLVPPRSSGMLWGVLIVVGTGVITVVLLAVLIPIRNRSDDKRRVTYEVTAARRPDGRIGDAPD